MIGQGNSNMFSLPIQKQERGDKILDFAKKAIYEWQHDHDVSQIESNVTASFKVINPFLECEEVHQKRSYVSKGGLKAQYANFKSSQHYKKFIDEVLSDETKKRFFQNKTPSISIEAFRRSLCKCVGDPTTESCVDVKQDKVFLSGFARKLF